MRFTAPSLRALIRAHEYEDWRRGRIVFDQLRGPLRALCRPEVDAARDNRSDSKAVLNFGRTKTVETGFHYQSDVGS